jgi:transcriptional regulator with XRE-family HTH domain
LEDVLKRLGHRIRELRLQRGFNSQEKFADFCGVDRTFMGHLETGRRDFRLSTIIRLADALDVGVADLFLEPGSSVSRHKHPRVRSAAIDRKRVLETAADLERAAKTLKDVAGGKLKSTAKVP